MRTVPVVFVVALVGLFARPAGAASHITCDLTLSGIDLRPGITADLHATVFVNPTHRWNGHVALAIDGLLHTAGTWEPLVTSLFEDDPAGRKMCRVVALDMPGRGGSVVHNLPWFGAVTLDDYIAAALGGLGQLNALHIRPTTLFGPSMGGLIIQLMQQRSPRRVVASEPSRPEPPLKTVHGHPQASVAPSSCRFDARGRPGPRASLKPSDTWASHLVREGCGRSSTFRRLVQRIEELHGFVFLATGVKVPAATEGAVLHRLQWTSDGGRCLWIIVKRDRPSAYRVGVLAHELQHAVEVLEDRTIRKSNDIEPLFRRLAAGVEGQVFETDAALSTGERVVSELARRRPKSE